MNTNLNLQNCKIKQIFNKKKFNNCKFNCKIMNKNKYRIIKIMKKKMNTYPIYETRKGHLQPEWYL